MAIGLSTFGSTQALPPLFGPISKPTSLLPPISILCRPRLRRKHLTICFVLEEREFITTPFQSQTPLNNININNDTFTSTSGSNNENDDEDEDTIVTRLSTLNDDRQISAAHLSDKLARKKSERFTYLVAAVMSSLGISSMAIMAVYYRFYWQMEGREIPMTEMLGTFALSVGAAVGMEFWARWAHRALWHASLWHMHESHHKPREGPFELNDVFAIINAVPAIALLNYGFFHKGLIPGLCFGAGLGITVFGIAYMFVHDGLVHKRFPVGPIADVPYFRRVAAAHQLHHSEKFEGVPYGLFMGPKELEEVGGLEELEKEINRRIKLSKGSNQSK